MDERSGDGRQPMVTAAGPDGATVLAHEDPEPSDLLEPRPGAAHRRDPDRRWPWLITAVALGLIAVSAVVWLLTRLPSNLGRSASPAAASATPTASPTGPPGAGLAIPGPSATGPASPLRSAAGLLPVPRVIGTPPPLPRPSTTAPPTQPSQPGQVVVPNVVGDRESVALTVLRAAGFRVAVLAVLPPVYQQRLLRPIGGIVVAQRPVGGQLAPAGSTVTILVGG